MGDEMIPCKFEHCKKYFDTQGAMVEHMSDEPDHEYCEPCGECMVDWEDMLRHLVRSEKHIACPSCGQEFKSVGGMERHAKQIHRAEQNIVCHGCTRIFRSAGDMIGHLAKGRCRNEEKPQQAITKEAFYEHISQKTIVKDMLEKANTNSQARAAAEIVIGPGSMGTVTTNNSQPGGVPVNVPSSGPSDWPALNNNQPIANGKSSDNGSNDNAERSVASLDFNSNPTISPKSVKSNAPSIAYQNIVSGAKNDTDGPNKPKSFAAALHDRDVEYQQRRHGVDTVTVPSSSLQGTVGPGNLNTRFWSPRSSQWDPERYFDSEARLYRCPHPRCYFTESSKTAFTAHCLGNHEQDVHQCRSCKREFKSRQALISHCEAPSHKCYVRKSKDYAQYMYELSGGFIDASNRNEKGEVIYGAMAPAEFTDRTKQEVKW